MTKQTKLLLVQVISDVDSEKNNNKNSIIVIQALFELEII